MFLFDSDLWPAASSCSLQIWARLTGFLPCWRWAAGIPVSDRARSGTVRCRRLYNSIHSQDRPRCQRSWGQRLRCVFYGTIAPWFADSRPRFLKTRKSLDTTLQRPKPLPLLGFEVLGSWQWPRRYKSGENNVCLALGAPVWHMISGDVDFRFSQGSAVILQSISAKVGNKRDLKEERQAQWLPIHPIPGFQDCLLLDKRW